MVMWISAHYGWLLSLAGLLTAILVINRVLRTGPTPAQAPGPKTSTPIGGPPRAGRSGLQDNSVREPGRPTEQGRPAASRSKVTPSLGLSGGVEQRQSG
ncbi:hypothetical protein H8B13_19010 [Hymenobacter sp. BT188]|uniref:hypothetical protein n=1 Tax=Hymenobacter sp. BT188 TaxID=2763504 RepID=UPI001651A330|nr:hypothetical protein [Hymenobacter sp. BT188]MBC6608919.1 hypothetical protein [Hymenobacter sp. BT188]